MTNRMQNNLADGGRAAFGGGGTTTNQNPISAGSVVKDGVFTSTIDLNGLQPGTYYLTIGEKRKRVVIR